MYIQKVFFSTHFKITKLPSLSIVHVVCAFPKSNNKYMYTECLKSENLNHLKAIKLKEL